MPFNIGPGELIVILIIALVVLGPGKLPDVASSLGKSVREFRRAATDLTDAGKLDTPATESAGPAQATTRAAPAAAPEAPATTAPAVPGAPPAEPAEPASDPNRS